MTDETMTVPCEGIGVWEGARVRMDDSTLDTDHGVVCHPATDGRWWVTFPRHRLSAAGPDHREIGLSRMSLDLTHRPTRLEVTNRLAERLYPQDAPIMSAAVMPGWAAWPDRLVYGISVVSLLSGEAWHSLDERAPALATLDPADDTRLPDGTRLVDVRALAIVAAHVFGSASSRPG